MSTRLTHHRRSLSELFDRWVMTRRVVLRAEANTRAEFDSALRSTQDELDIEIRLTRELGRRFRVGFPELCALRVRMAEEIRTEDERAEFQRIVAEFAHPSNGGEG